MKKGLLILFALMSALSFSSCKKCTTCTLNYIDSRTGTKVVKDYPKECGKQRDVDNFKQYMNQSAFILDGTYSCVDSK